MALDKKTFQTRTITAIVFAAVMLLGLFTNLFVFSLLFAIVQIGCWIEYLSLIEKIYNTRIDKIIKYFFAVCGLAIMFVFGLKNISYNLWMKLLGYEINIKYIFWVVLIIGCFVVVFQNKQIEQKAKFPILGGFLYISLPLCCLLNIRDGALMAINVTNWINIGQVYVIAIIFSIWINDTMAYIVGSLIGKTPFSKISPKKTWEGTAGGAILCVVVIALLGAFIPAAQTVPVKHWIVIAALCAVFGTLGDLFESKLKRMANVKDSGSFMPGHGGFLDRFDSLLLAAPAVWVYLKLFGL